MVLCIQSSPCFQWDGFGASGLSSRCIRLSFAFAALRRIVVLWPDGQLPLDGAVAAPYCDNIAIFGATKSDANSGLARVLPAFERIGFAMHEVRHASLGAQPLGCHFDGARLRVGSKPEKLWRLRRAARL